MNRWGRREYNEYLHRREKADDSAPVPDPQPEQSPRPESLGSDQGEGPGKGRIVVRIISLRTSLLDEDNLAGGCKYITDAIRNVGLIRDDNPGATALRWEQKKVPHKDQEETVIEITYP